MTSEQIEAAWQALKVACCSEPKEAKRCVMVSQKDFKDVIKMGMKHESSSKD